MAGGLTTFNIQDGFVEALVRGYRLGILTDSEFNHLSQCETLEDVRLNLQETDYGNFLQNEPSPLSPAMIRSKAIEKLVCEFEYLRSQAAYPLSKFLDYIVYDYQIDNLMLLLKATLKNPQVNVAALTEQLHPLGKFKDGIIRSICTFENSPRGYAELYHTVLVGIPVGKYMRIFLNEEGEKGMRATGQVRSLLEEMPTTKLENSLRKYYLEDFYRFCNEEIGGETGVVMSSLLKSRADAYAINITLNSFETALNDLNMRPDRQNLFPSIGHLYPDGFSKIASVSNDDELGQSLRFWKQYNKIFESYRSEEKTIDDLFYEKEVMECELAFEGQFNYSCFYAYVRIKEAEIRNLTWISECIIQRAKSRIMQHYVPIFTRSAQWRS